MNGPPQKSSISAFKEDMLDGFLTATEAASHISIPVPL